VHARARACVFDVNADRRSGRFLLLYMRLFGILFTGTSLETFEALLVQVGGRCMLCVDRVIMCAQTLASLQLLLRAGTPQERAARRTAQRPAAAAGGKPDSTTAASSTMRALATGDAIRLLWLALAAAR
jgi:hypothetical protein